MSLATTNKIIHLASDHAGFEHKEAILKWFAESGYKVVDHGAMAYDETDDFPDFISLAAKAVSLAPEDSCGIIFGGSGQGEAMLANRYPNVRATVFYGGDKSIISLSRSHNDANILSFGSRFLTLDEIKAGIKDWLSTNVEVIEKYQRRNQKIEQITKKLRSL